MIVLVMAGLAIMGLVLLRHRQHSHRTNVSGHEVAESGMCTAAIKSEGEIFIPMRSISALFKKGHAFTVLSPTEGCYREGQVVTVLGSKKTSKTHQIYFHRLSVIATIDKVFRLEFAELDLDVQNFMISKDGEQAKQEQFDRVEFSNPSGPTQQPPDKGPEGHPMARVLANFQDLVSKYKGPITVLTFPNVKLDADTASFPKKIVGSMATKIEDPEDAKSHGFSSEITPADADKVWVVIGHGPGDMRAYNAITQLSLKGAKYVYWLRNPAH